MDNHTFTTMVIRMDAVLTNLDKEVTLLRQEVASLQKRQNYWSGAVAAIGVCSSAIGAAAATVFQWLHQ